MDKATVDQWKGKIPDIITKYDLRDIYNLDETGLFYRVLPNKTKAFKEETCNGGKVSKERLTVLRCCNIDGEFERPLIIGKAKRPRSFKKLDVNKFPIDWYWNKKARMTIEITTTWQIDKKMRQKKRKVLLFLDNAAPHPHLKLKNVELVFFPPNMTSMIQPLDQGIIQQFKKLYRKKLLQTVIAYNEAMIGINVLDAIYWAAVAYKEIKPETVKKCFLHSGFYHHTLPHNDDDDDSTCLLDSQLTSLIGMVNHSVTAEEYLAVDKNLSTHDADADFATTSPNGTIENEEESEEEEPKEEVHIRNLQDAREAAKHIRAYLLSIEVHNSSLFPTIIKLETDLLDEWITKRHYSGRQTTLTDYFHRQ